MTRVAVLMGGFSSEREISLSSGKGCVEGLESAGFDVTPVDVTRNVEALLKALDPAPDVVFNALHGPFGEDGRIQGLLDILEIPYTHSGALASAMAMDKSVSRAIFALQNIPVAEGWVVPSSELDAFNEPARPYVMKPLCEGSSVGVQIAFETDNKPWEELRREYTKYERILIERYVPGREIQVAVIGDVALGAIEIRTPRRFYDYRAKYTAGESEHLMPAPLHEGIYELALELSLKSHAALGCRGVSRVDLRYDDTRGNPGDLIVLEVNTQPGMTPTSLVPEIAAHAGWTLENLLIWMVEHAACDA